MLRDEASGGEYEAGWAWSANVAHEQEWQAVDRKLRGLAKQRAALDAEEARWLREAERVEIWKPFGMVNMLDYLERALGYGPRTAQKRLQVARALGHLPATTEALANGRTSFSAVRELVRVATPATEREWLDHVDGMNLRQIEDAVSGRRPGDLPSDPPDDTAREHVVMLRLNASAYARYREGRLRLDEEHDHKLDDSEVVEALFSPSNMHGDGDHSGSATFQIAMTVCERCRRGWQDAAGVQVPVNAATVERAHCDAQFIGSLDGAGPARAHQDVPPSVDRFVRRRDHGKCQTPGCRSARGLEIHHIVHREHGGTHEPENLTLRCSACHAAHHEGRLQITGEAPDRIVTTRLDKAVLSRVHVDATAHGASPTPTRFEQVALRTQARDALVTLGWKPGIARAAVEEVCAHAGTTGTLEELIREARCPRPRVEETRYRDDAT